MPFPVQSPAAPVGVGQPSSVDFPDAVVQATIRVVRSRAFHEVDLELIADEAGLSVAEVLERSPSLNDLMITTIRTWNEHRMTPILPVAHEQGAVAFLRAIVLANVADPALMRLLSATVNIAATPGHPMAPVLQQQWVQFHAVVQRALSHDVSVGREPTTMEPSRGAEQLIAMYEGLQLQSMLRPNMDLLESYDRAVTRLRDGWSRTYSPPVWEI